VRPEKKGQFFGGVIGMIVGGVLAYILWDFSPPGGILILAGFALGGLIGFNLARDRNRARERRAARDEKEEG
jgi:hypothetical protein